MSDSQEPGPRKRNKKKSSEENYIDKTLSENEFTESESDKNNHVLFPQNSPQKQWKMYPVSRGSGIGLDEDRMDSGDDSDDMNVVLDYSAQDVFEKKG